MYTIDHTALKRLPNEASRLLIQRWVELTHDRTHPEWRLRPIDSVWATSLLRGSGIQCSRHPKLRQILEDIVENEPGGFDIRLLMEAVQDNDLEKTYSYLPLAATCLIQSEHSRRWQHITVLSFLLDPKGAASLPFYDRLEAMLGLTEAAIVPADSVRLVWPLSPKPAASARIRGLKPLVSSESGFRVSLCLGTEERKNWYQLEGEPVQDSLRAFVAAGYETTNLGAIWLSLLRLAFPDLYLRPEPQFLAANSLYLRPLKAEPPPALWSRREAQQVIMRLVQLLNQNPGGELQRRLVGGLEWASCATLRWTENPAFATSLLWMALESLSDGCVYRCGHSCSSPGQHVKPMDAYIADRNEALAEDIDEYVMGIRGTDEDRYLGRRRPPEWWLLIPERTKIGTEQWLLAVADLLSENDGFDPLLLKRVTDLRRDIVGMSSGGFNLRIKRDLRLLESTRHVLAHTGHALLDEGVYGYLASFAMQVFRSSLSWVEQLVPG